MNKTINELKERLTYILNLDDNEIEKLYNELLSYFSISVEDYVIKEHNELKRMGYKNKEIYPVIIANIEKRLFKGKKFSERQIKRIIYGD